MISTEQWDKYARLVVEVGVNVKAGETVFVNADVESAPFARQLVRQAYLHGAERAQVLWNDTESTLYDYTLGGARRLLAPAQWEKDCKQYIADNRCCYINVVSRDPEAFASVDKTLLAQAARANRAAYAPFMEASMANRIKWCIVAAPSAGWAKRIFPTMPAEQACDALYALIAKAMRLDQADSIAAWAAHDATLKERCAKLNNLGLTTLHYHNASGTDLTVRLPQGYVFEGGSELSRAGCVFSPNMPTEEIFSAPYREGVDGTVVASLPLFYQGAKIDGLGMRLRNGRIVDYWAKEGYDVLQGIIETDEGSHYLGEVALVPYDSPINNLNTVFFTTLFDENARCHLAIGDAYPSSVKGGNEMSDDELAKAGLNSSLVHVDFMIGTADLHITGTCADGRTVAIFDKGNFVG